MQQGKNQGTVSTYHIAIDDEKLGIKPEVLFKMYSDLDSRSRTLAPQEVRHELRITQDGKIKTRFNILVSNRMAPYLIQSIQELINNPSFGPKLYFQKLQEQVMANLFAGAPDVIN